MRDNGSVTDQPPASPTPSPEGATSRSERPRSGHPEPEHPQPTARQQVSAYAAGSVANMLRSMLVIAAIMALFIIMFPRIQPDHSGVDVTETARQIQESTGVQISAPSDLPDGWVATRAEYRRGVDGLMTWHAGFEAPGGGFVALNETVDATDAWVTSTVNETERIGEREIAAQTWQQHSREGTRPQRSLVDRGASGELTTVVTGSASWEELQVFVESLAPAASVSQP